MISSIAANDIRSFINPCIHHASIHSFIHPYNQSVCCSESQSIPSYSCTVLHFYCTAHSDNDTDDNMSLETSLLLLLIKLSLLQVLHLRVRQRMLQYPSATTEGETYYTPPYVHEYTPEVSLSW